jgi:hypothetical protein
MESTTFETVYNVPELGNLIMESLALTALIALSYTSRAIHGHVQQHMRSKLSLILAPFGIGRRDLMTQLRFAESFIIGSIALKAVAPSTWSITTNNIDIVVQCAQLTLLEDWLMVKCGYKRRSPNHTNSGYNAPFRFCYSYTRKIDQRDMYINLLAVRSRSEGYELIFHASNTTGMNMLSPRGLFTGYATLLNHRQVAHNQVTNMASMRTIYSVAERRQDRIDRANDRKAQSRGFEFVTLDPSPHPFDTCLRCPYVSACPLTIRNMNDSMCAYMRLVRDDETAGQSVLSPEGSRRPEVIWRLADVQGGRQGFAYHLTYCRINDLR